MVVSAQVVEKRRDSAAVVEACTTHADQAGQALTEALAPHRAAGEPAIDGAVLLRQLARLLVAVQGLLDEADAAHHRELADDHEPQARKVKFGTQTYQALVRVRSVIDVLGGSEAMRAVGFDGPTPRVPDVLADLAPKVAERLPAVAEKLPAPPGLAFDTAALVAQIQEPLPALQTAQADRRREAKEAEATQMTKWRALEQHDRTIRVVAGLASLIMELGGLYELADRVRPPVRRSAGAGWKRLGPPASRRPRGHNRLKTLDLMVDLSQGPARRPAGSRRSQWPAGRWDRRRLAGPGATTD